VFDKFVPIGRCKAFFDFANTPLVVAIELAYEPFDGLKDQRFGIPASLGGDSGKLAFELRRKVDFHATSLEV
jgi:hypothetical protein